MINLAEGNINNLTIARGDVSTNVNDNLGGGVRSFAALSMTNVTVRDCKALSGGGIYSRGYLKLTNAKIRMNQAVGNIAMGGGIQASGGYFTMSGGEIDSNSSDQNSGGLDLDCGATLDKVSIARNTAANFDGGGLTIESATTAISNSTIGRGNKALNGKGGGISVIGGLKLYQSTVAENEAFQGGGIYVADSGTVDSKSSTIGYNTGATNGGGINIQMGGTVQIVNTAVFGNSAPNGPDILGTVTSGGTNLIETDAGSNGWVASDLRNRAANFTPLGAWGGPTETCVPIRGSPAIDAGNNAAVPFSDGDQRGDGFIRIVNERVDIGAVEKQ